MYLIVLHSLYSEVTFNRSIYMLCCFYFVCCILKDMVKRRPFFITLLTLHVVFCWICSIDESPCACITFFLFLHFEYRILQDMFNSWISIYYFLYLLCLLYFTGLGMFNRKISMYYSLYLLCRMLQYFTGHFQ